MEEISNKQTHIYPIQTRFCDTDALGHINNAVYLSYFEACRVDWLNQMAGVMALEQGQALPVILARAELDFIQQVYLRDSVEVTANIIHIGNTSFQQCYQLRCAERGVLAKGRAVLVWFDMKTNRKLTIPDTARKYMENYRVND